MVADIRAARASRAFADHAEMVSKRLKADSVLFPSRERSIAMTKLEEAIMWLEADWLKITEGEWKSRAARGKKAKP